MLKRFFIGMLENQDEEDDQDDDAASLHVLRLRPFAKEGNFIDPAVYCRT